MNQRLIETIKLNKDKMKDGAFIDAYNQVIRDDGLCGTILTGIDYRNMHFVVVKNDKRIKDKTV